MSYWMTLTWTTIKETPNYTYMMINAYCIAEQDLNKYSSIRSDSFYKQKKQSKIKRDNKKETIRDIG